MVDRVLKRDGRRAVFSERRIREAISAAMRDTGISTYNVIGSVTDACVSAIHVKYDEQTPTVEQIQDVVVEILREMKLRDVADNFEEYRAERTSNREMKSDVMKAIKKIGEETTRDNANVGNNFSAKLLQIASTANKWVNLANMPKEFAKAHESGDAYMHDLDSYNLTVNCLNIDAGEVLNRGFNPGYGTINKPNSIESAASLSCILVQSGQNDCFGGQALIDYCNYMAEYIQCNRDKITQDIIELKGEVLDSDKAFIERKIRKQVRQAMQIMCYNLNTLHCRSGSQIPFSSINLGLPKSDDAAMVYEELLMAYDAGLGKGELMIFPNIIVALKKGVNFDKDDKYRYLTDIAIKVSARRMNPTYRFYDSSMDIDYYNAGVEPATMGCRTNVCANINGDDGPAGRGNIAPVSMNLPRLGIEAKGDWNKFYKSLDKLINLCERQLMHRYGVLKQLKIRDLPFAAGQNLMRGSEGLGMDDSIEPILKQGTWGIGFIGISETLIAMMGVHHGESEEAFERAKEIVEFMYGRIMEIKDRLKLNFALYSTPAEGLSSKFTDNDIRKYGIIEGVTDHVYYTNSFHINPSYNISAIKKVDLEGQLHHYSTAGVISYIEIDGGNLEERAEYIRRHLEYCGNNTDITYIAYNFRIRYCKQCGQDVQLGTCTCPVCGSDKMQGASRVNLVAPLCGDR